MRFGSRMTAAATTGPASGPRPASSQPAMGQMPLASARRSRLNVGRTTVSASGRRSGLRSTLAFAALAGRAGLIGRDPAQRRLEVKHNGEYAGSAMGMAGKTQGLVRQDQA